LQSQQTGHGQAAIWARYQVDGRMLRAVARLLHLHSFPRNALCTVKSLDSGTLPYVIMSQRWF